MSDRSTEAPYGASCALCGHSEAGDRVDSLEWDEESCARLCPLCGGLMIPDDGPGIPETEGEEGIGGVAYVCVDLTDGDLLGNASEPRSETRTDDEADEYTLQERLAFRERLRASVLEGQRRARAEREERECVCPMCGGSGTYVCRN